MYEPEIGDEITFANAEINRNVVYTITEINDVEVTVTTPKGYVFDGDFFAYRLAVDVFETLGPRKLQAK